MDSSPDPLNQLAARWYARLRAPDCTKAEREQFEAWRAEDPRNAAAYAAAERMNDALAKLAATDPRLKAMVDQAASSGATLLDDEHEDPPTRKPTKLTITSGKLVGTRSRRVTHLARWVAAIAVATIAGLAWIERGDIEPAQGESTYRYAGVNPVLRYTSGASRRAVTLDDGTRVYLDVASIIDVRFDTARRAVTLVQGRALFDAAHDAVRPFVVTVGTDRVTALGTLFQVDRSPSELVVTLAQGSVSVTNQTNAETIRLSPGEELRLSASGTHWSTRNVDTQSATSWAQF